MRASLGLTLLLVAAACRADGPPASSRPDGTPATSVTITINNPQITLDHVPPDALIAQARAAMTEYIARRTPADKQRLLPELLGLQSIKHAAAVGIRIDGQLKAQAFADSSDFCRNVVTASLLAMRGPSLPDKITPKLIESATIEIESIESPTAVATEQIAGQYIPGLTGLLLDVDGKRAYSLPSAGYEFGLTATQMVARCQAQLPSKGKQAAWMTFGGRHFVGYPGQPAVRLFRGKQLGNEVFDRADRLAAAGNIGLYLQTHQDRDGRFRAGGMRGTLVEHLYASIAMAGLARAGGLRYDPAPAVKHAQAAAKKAGDLTYLATDPPADQLLAAAFYIIASDEAGLKDDATRDDLVRTIAARMELPAMPARLDAGSQQPASPTALYIAARAMAGRDQKLSPLLTRRAETTAPDSALAALWKNWAGIEIGNLSPGMTLAPTQSKLPDEQGALVVPGENMPTTVINALAAVGLRGRPRGSDSQVPDLQRFCMRMVYRPREAFFAADPADWVGAVRMVPAASHADLAACAATIECLLVP